MPLRPFLIPALCAFAGLSACGDGVRISSTRSENNDAKGVLKVIVKKPAPAQSKQIEIKSAA